MKVLFREYTHLRLSNHDRVPGLLQLRYCNLTNHLQLFIDRTIFSWDFENLV